MWLKNGNKLINIFNNVKNVIFKIFLNIILDFILFGIYLYSLFKWL